MNWKLRVYGKIIWELFQTSYEMLVRDWKKWFTRVKKSKGLTIKDLEKQLQYLNSLSPVLGNILDTKLAINCEVYKEEIY